MNTRKPDRLEAARLEKLHRIEELGLDPWGQRFDDHIPIDEARRRCPAEAGTDGDVVRVAGRIMLRNNRGKLKFYHVQDWTGRIQLMVSRGDLSEVLEALALPIATLTFAVLAHMTRMTRAAVLNVMSSPYIEQAILKGASRRRVIIRHALPNALAPIVNVIALNLAYLVSGVVVVEAIFRIPGLGTLMVESVIFRDIPTVQAIGMLFCVTYVGFNLLADVMAIIANPRLRHPR